MCVQVRSSPSVGISLTIPMNNSITAIAQETHEEEARRETRGFERISVGRLLGLIAGALLALFLVLVVADSLPVRLMDPAWQLRFSGALIRNGLMPVLAIVMVPLAAVIDPSSGALARYRDRLRHWTILVALGYVLLIPLQGYAVWKGVGQLRSSQAGQFDRATKQFTQLRQTIQSADSTADLQRRFQALGMPTQPQADLNQPLPVLRKRLLDGLEGAENRLRNRLVGKPSADSVEGLILQGGRLALSALILAFAFAAGSQRRRSRVSLLEEWRQAWSQRARRRWNRNQANRLRR